MPHKVLKGLFVDAAALVRAYPPMVVAFATVLAGAAIVFDLIYLTAALPPGLIAISMVPLLAGLIACLIAADDLGLRGPVVARTVGAAGALLLTNVAAVAMIAAIRGTGWKSVLQSIGLAIVTVACIAGTAVMLSSLARSLDITLATRLPERKPKPAPLTVLAKPVAKKKVAEPPGPAPRAVKLAEVRPARLPDYVPGHADGRVVRARRTVSSRRERRRPPGYGR